MPTTFQMNRTFNTYYDLKRWMCDFQVRYEPINENESYSIMPVDFDYDTQSSVKEHFKSGGKVSLVTTLSDEDVNAEGDQIISDLEEYVAAVEMMLIELRSVNDELPTQTSQKIQNAIKMIEEARSKFATVEFEIIENEDA